LLPVTGLAALIWFLVRVIPKPSRAAYPCQRVAAPMASTFVIWLLGVGGSTLAIRNARLFFRRSRYVMAALCVVLALIGVSVVLDKVPESRAAGWTPSEPLNSPKGVARGARPGRVAWVHDPDATSWDGSTGHWWQDSNTDQGAVSNMMSDLVRWLAGETTDERAWDTLFRHFNQQAGKGNVGFQDGEKIAIKVNLNGSSHDPWEDAQNASPHVVHALLWQLVWRAGVTNQSDISVCDPSRGIGLPIWDKCHTDFPSVRYVDNYGTDGRIKAQPDMGVAITHADTNVHFRGQTYVARSFTEADYVINMALLRGHSLAGISVNAKNHFGSVWVDWATNNPPRGWTPNGPDDMKGMHGYIAPFDYNSGGWNFAGRETNSYNALVELMGHRHLGGKTLLFIVDGLYGVHHQHDAEPVKWQMTPFSNDWTSSLFGSQDGVAIESVVLDFLRSESIYDDVVKGTVDNYLHEAAEAGAPPSLSFYDPEADGTNMASLGVHEHWDNAVNKRYSRNLGTGDGIELVSSPAVAYAHLAADFASLDTSDGSLEIDVCASNAYTVQMTTNLLDGESWIDLTSGIPPTTPWHVEDPDWTNLPCRFYQVILDVE